MIPNYDEMRVLLDPGTPTERLSLPTVQGNFALYVNLKLSYKVSPGMHLI